MEIDVRLAKIDNNIANINKSIEELKENSKATNEMITSYSQALIEQELACERYRGSNRTEQTQMKNNIENNKNNNSEIGKQLKTIDKIMKGLLISIIITLIGVVGTLLKFKI